ncbi:MAG: type I glyceraldehyde-3-phosphate dehydrogenase [Aigarchaeota archaeon]|nr:type I glyceraldehyde-3-phosphate dehydrogenase [Aigarchaeota archaeon]MCX8192378.1 type I glyceraldehyde-3-phosphate dehydrogenase [Nitrososphaeria archaeon]MDW7986953.1 type I glyceraldehyde-3-phosphate dehydrogenase [Nitrososphaerota archaeon]
MVLRVGINGLGRIGRLFLRAALEDPRYRKNFEIVAFNELADTKTTALLLKYDSVHRRLNKNISYTDKSIIIDGEEIRAYSIKDPSQIPWREEGVEVIVEATGQFTSKSDASKHIRDTVKKVLVTAPCKDADVTIVPGVNDHMLDLSKHDVISGASCTTNCLAPMVKVLLDEFGIKKGFMTTVHAYTNDQRVLDLVHRDLRRARAAALSIIPTTTGAASALHLVIPEVKGKMDGIALRVPVPDGSVTDLIALLEREVTVDEVKNAYKKAAEGRMKNILEYTEDPIVSADVIGNPHSCIIDGLSIMVIGDKNDIVKVLGWYDNEWGYSCRMVDIVNMIAQKL